MATDFPRHAGPQAYSSEVIQYFRSALAKELNSEEPIAFVIFGASGDLAKKMIFPTLWWLFRYEILPTTNFTIIGYARSAMTIEQLRGHFEQYCKVQDDEKELFEKFILTITYVQGAYDKPDGFVKLTEIFDGIQASSGKPVNRLLYLALPSSVYDVVTVKISEHLMTDKAWVRIIVEKPFGYDSDSSAELSRHLAKLFREDQIYRIDHYLGEEMVQNLMVLRFGNRLFAPSWNRDNIKSVMISFKEDFGTFGRAGYFDKAGIIRDVVQNHLMQVLTLIAMEKPASLGSEDIRDEKVKVMKAMRPVELNEVVIGQYFANPESSLPEAGKGYKDDPDVPNDSRTSTYSLTVQEIKNERWEGVPFFIRCGKALNETHTEVRIQFKDVAGDIYEQGQLRSNQLVIRVSPGEAVHMKLMVKKPGMGFDVENTELDLTYSEKWKGLRLPGPYERLLMEVFAGSQKNFVRTDELEHAWRIWTPILKQLESVFPHEYKFGIYDLPEGEDLLREHGYEPSSHQ